MLASIGICAPEGDIPASALVSQDAQVKPSDAYLNSRSISK